MEKESMGRRNVILVIILGIASVLVLWAGILPSAQADKQFANRSVEGTWGYSASGNVTDIGSAVAVGLATMDGRGGCSIKETLNMAVGTVIHTSTACTYNVNPDGTGTLTAVFDDPSGTVPVSFVIVNRKSEIHFIRTDLGAVVSGVAKRR